MPSYNGQYEEQLRPFFDAMRYKLARNAHKGNSWEGMTFEELLGLMRKEVEELREAIAIGNTSEILMEAADVGNFAFFCANLALAAAHRGTGAQYDRPQYDRPQQGVDAPARPAANRAYTELSYGDILGGRAGQTPTGELFEELDTDPHGDVKFKGQVYRRHGQWAPREGVIIRMWRNEDSNRMVFEPHEDCVGLAIAPWLDGVPDTTRRRVPRHV